MSDELSDISAGTVADNSSTTHQIFRPLVQSKFEIFSYRNAASILKYSFPAHFAELEEIFEKFAISESMIRRPGGSKSTIAKYVDTLFSSDWQETRIAADLHVRLIDAKKSKKLLSEYTREGFLDGHRIDFVKGKVALDLEWNSKDQTYDRDLYAFSAFYEAGAIDVGIILTRGSSMDNHYFRRLGKVLHKDGTPGNEDVYKKYGASTTWMGKLLYRLNAGRNGGCPVLAVGITPNCVVAD